jgi:hypothetical protein
MAVRLSALRAGHALPRENLPVVVSVRDWVNIRAMVRLEGLRKFKKNYYLIGTRARDLPACSIAPEPFVFKPSLYQ